MSDSEQAKYDRRLQTLVRDRRIAKMSATDRWHLPPVAPGWLRGAIQNVRQSEETCEFGALLVMDFDLFPDPEQPGIPVRMNGTYFTNQLQNGMVMDIPDPTPSERPVTPIEIFYSHTARAQSLRAYYPGRDAMTRRRGALMGVLAIGVPAAALIITIAVLHLVFRVF